MLLELQSYRQIFKKIIKYQISYRHAPKNSIYTCTKRDESIKEPAHWVFYLSGLQTEKRTTPIYENSKIVIIFIHTWCLTFAESLKFRTPCQILTTFCILKLCDKVRFCTSVSTPYKNTYTIIYISLIAHQTQRPFRILNRFKKCMKCEIIGSHSGGESSKIWIHLYQYKRCHIEKTWTFNALSYYFLINYILHIDGQGPSFRDIWSLKELVNSCTIGIGRSLLQTIKITCLLRHWAKH